MVVRQLMYPLLQTLDEGRSRASRCVRVAPGRRGGWQVGLRSWFKPARTFATVRLRQRVTKGTRITRGRNSMAYKLIDAAQARYRPPIQGDP
jgi:hypothetical protein